MTRRAGLLAPPVVDDVSRRGLLTGLGALAALTACSTAPPPPVATTRPFVDGTGATVQVPDRPSRIYAVRDNEIAGLLLSVGGSVVGFNGDVDPIRRAGLDPGAAVAQAGELGIEAVAALRPDLIVLAAGDITRFYGPDGTADRLRTIAPVVGIDITQTTVEQATASAAALLGPSAAVDPATLQARFDQELAALCDAAGVPWDTVTVAHVQPRADTYSAYAPNTTVVNDLLDRLGVRWNALNLRAIDEGGFLLDQSLETVDALAADLLIYDVLNDVDLDDNPLFAALPQVRAGQVLRFDENVYGKHLVNYATVARTLTTMITAMAPLRTGLAP